MDTGSVRPPAACFLTVLFLVLLTLSDYHQHPRLLTLMAGSTNYSKAIKIHLSVLISMSAEYRQVLTTLHTQQLLILQTDKELEQ